MSGTDNLSAAAARVDYRLTYDRTSTPRECVGYGINGPDLPNAYFGRGLVQPDQDSEFGSGNWENPEHPEPEASEDTHVAAWFETAVREAIHEACEWFWVDGSIYLNPHGEHEAEIHRLSGQVAEALVSLRNGGGA